MKQILLFFCLISVLAMQAQPPKGKAKPGTVYGDTINPRYAVSIADLVPAMQGGDTMEVVVQTKVINSCASKGCWMNVVVNDSLQAFVKFKNYGFFVPTDIKGKNVVMQGKLYKSVTSVEDLKHYAKDAGKSQKEIDAITKPREEIRFLANGVLVTVPNQQK